MKTRLFVAIGALALFALPIYAQSGFVDKPSAPGGFVDESIIAIEKAKGLRDHDFVQLQGNIMRRVSDEKYLFRDASGIIVVKIDDDVWRGLTVGPDDTVVLSGKIDKDFPGASVKVEVFSIRKP
jgi:uncharacterized protein (TIGR00156 family)